MSTYADWKAPKVDGESLLWPEPQRLVADLAQNRAALDVSTVAIQNKPLNEWRLQTRQAVLGDAAKSVIATGHQIELYHPGVWIKNVLLDAVARKTGAVALHVAVDTDSPKHLQFRWPGGAIDASDDILLKTGEWSGQVDQPSAAHLKKIRDRFAAAAAGWSFAPSAGRLFDSLEASQKTDAMLPQALLDAAKAVDATLGLSYKTRLLSELIQLPAYHALVHHIAGDIERYAASYNAALAEYRDENGIDSLSRPMPDLRVDDDTIELPFWFDRLDTGDRSRGVVVRGDCGGVAGRWHLLADEACFAFDPTLPGDVAAERLAGFCRENNLRLTPRALTLTTFLRLMVTDQFVHGIGGGRYDQVTDRILESYFGIPAPAFAVTTGTLYFPDAGERDVECVPCLVNEGHRLRHSVIEKLPYLDRITASPRRSAARKAAYIAMHGSLQTAVPASPTLAEWRERLAHAIDRRDREAVLFDRELLFAIQPRERLQTLIDRVRAQIA